MVEINICDNNVAGKKYKESLGREPRVVLLQLNEINSLINVSKCFSSDSVSQSGNVRQSELSGSGIKYRFRVVYR